MDQIGCRRCTPLRPLPCSISEIFDTFENERREIVDGGSVYLCPTSELLPYLKKHRTRENALTPGRVQNREGTEDAVLGQQKWDRLLESIRENGFRVTDPITFILFKKNAKRTIHQGHHRIGIARELNIEAVPVVFNFVPQSGLQPSRPVGI
jgi:hypothetical protein